MNKWLALSLKIVISGGLLYFVLRGIDVGSLKIILKQARLGLILLAIVLYCSGQVVCAYRWKVLLAPASIQLTYGRTLGLFFLGMFFNLFFPTVVGGDAVKVYYLVREGGDVARSTTTVLMDRNAGLCGLLLIAVVVAGWANVHLGTMPLFPLLVGVLALYGLANVILFYDATYRWLARRFERARLRKLVTLTGQLHSAFTAYRRASLRLMVAVALSLVFDGALIGLAYLAAKAIGWSIGLEYFCVYIPLISLISMVPITLYGVGLREYLFVTFFPQAGMTEEASLLLAFLFFFVVLVSSLPGAIVYIFYRRRGKRWRREPPA